MDVKKLEKDLNEVLDNYYRELSLLDEYDKTPVTKGELAEHLKQTRYALEGIKNSVVGYLENL